jgi:hypothetical protein
MTDRVTSADEVYDRTDRVEVGPTGRETRPNTLVWRFLLAWGMLQREIGRDPTLQEYRDWWPLSMSAAQAYWDAFRRCFPEEPTPNRLGALLWQGAAGCPRCLMRVDVPRDLSVRSRIRISDARRRGGALDAQLELYREAGFDSDAKRVAFHLAGDGPSCHRCAKDLPVGQEVMGCPDCHALNVIWGLRVVGTGV